MLRQASDESFSDYLVRFEAQMARAHRVDASEDESYAEAVAVFKHQEAEQRALERRNLIRTMTTPDSNIPTLEAGSEKGTNTTVVAKNGLLPEEQEVEAGREEECEDDGIFEGPFGVQDVALRLPSELREFADLFRKEKANALTPPRGKADHHIRLKRDADGALPELPSAPLAH
ncbi:hypothetical protein E4U24_000369, partial [Claviceps purpurea]